MDGGSDFVYDFPRSSRHDLHLMGRGDQITRPGLLGTPGLVFFWSVVGRGIGYCNAGWHWVGGEPQLSKPAGFAQRSHWHNVRMCVRIGRLRIPLNISLECIWAKSYD